MVQGVAVDVQLPAGVRDGLVVGQIAAQRVQQAELLLLSVPFDQPQKRRVAEGVQRAFRRDLTEQIRDAQPVILVDMLVRLEPQADLQRLLGLPHSVPGMSLNRFCSSGLQAIAVAAGQIEAGLNEILVAGGVESMSVVTMNLDHSNDLSPAILANDPDQYMPMGITAENVAARYGVTRQEMDALAAASHAKAAAAQCVGKFDDEIIPLPGVDEEGRSIVFDLDQGIRAGTTIGKLAELKPCFKADGAVTAATSSQVSDGAGFVVHPDDIIAEGTDEELPVAWKGYLCIAAVIILSLVFQYVMHIAAMQAVVYAMLIGIILCFLLVGKKHLPHLLSTCVKGFTGSVTPIVLISFVVGYGAVVKQTAAFAWLVEKVLSMNMHHYLLTFFAVNILAGLTANGVGGVTLFMNTFGEQLVANSAINLGAIHRIASIAGSGFDSLPHNGAISFQLSVFKLSYKEGYFQRFMMSVIVNLLAGVIAVVIGMLFY